jgi:nuclear inhibitor of protein phosphatase 1
MELDNLTEFNTAHNRRITMIGIANEMSKKKRRIRITFDEDEEVINPEDVDPAVGRFRNMIETTIIPKKRPHSEGPGLLGTRDDSVVMKSPVKRLNSGGSLTSPVKGPGIGSSGLYEGMEVLGMSMALPNPAPDIDMAPPEAMFAAPLPPAATAFQQELAAAQLDIEDPDEPKRKKYAKEAWPGKKPTPSLLV